jgi:type I restriction enzyme S subunit
MKYKIGELVEPVSLKCGIPDYENVSGVNIDKRFMPSRNVGADTSKYLVVKPGNFASNLMHVGRDEKIPVAMNDGSEDVIVSSAYFVFRVKTEEMILKEYLYMLMIKPDFDRLAWFCTDSSVRGGLDWDRFCDITIDLPPLSVQQKYVDVYKAMLANQRAYESGLEDLTTAINAQIEQFKHTAKRVPMGELLEEIDVRNNDSEISDVQGININKQFMPSVANLSTTDLSKYKVINKGQFAYSAMQTGRDECIRIALYYKDTPCVISPAYSVLKTKSNADALAEYIMLWFSRSESDRYGWFISDSSIRASLELSRFYEIEIPLPPLKEQQALVNFYNARQLIQNNVTKLSETIKEICPILIKGSVEEAKT